jgi:hypothetical protein
VRICVAADDEGFPCCCLVVVEEGEFEGGEGARRGGYGGLEVAQDLEVCVEVDVLGWRRC